jgi:DNA-binding response OmpR family regulator
MSAPGGDSDSKPVILAADDDEDILELVTFRLGRSGYIVLQARDGEEALQLALEHRPDIAVLDVSMPKLNGIEVTRRLRAQEETSAIPIILLTASVQDADVESGFAAGATDYVRKPFSPMELVARVQAALRG